jgi:hypothetical protein
VTNPVANQRSTYLNGIIATSTDNEAAIKRVAMKYVAPLL